MRDSIPKNTGNSRNLRTALPAGTSWEQALALMRAGTFPIDMAGINPGGFDVVGNSLGKETLLSDTTEEAIWGNAGDRTVSEALGQVQRNMQAKLLYEKWTSGAFSYTVPAGVTKIGVMLSGGGASGNAKRTTSGTAFGGGSGELKQYVLSVTPGQVLSGTIGAGGAGVAATTDAYTINPGGSSSCSGVTALGGQGPSIPSIGGQTPDYVALGDAWTTNGFPAPFGCAAPRSQVNSNVAVVRNLTSVAINLFDARDPHLYCGAGGYASVISGGTQYPQVAPARSKGKAGSGTCGTASKTAESATGPGDGGGACFVTSGTATSGAGAPGFIRIYDLTGKEEASV